MTKPYKELLPSKGKVTITIEEVEDGEIIISVESEDKSEEFKEAFLSEDNQDIDLQKIEAVMKLTSELPKKT